MKPYHSAVLVGSALVLAYDDPGGPLDRGTFAPSHTYQPPTMPGAKVRSAKAERNARKAARRARARAKR
jgi:hypothetical protein